MGAGRARRGSVLRGLVGGGATAGRRPVAAHGEGAGDRLDPITAAKSGDKGVSESRIGKIEGDRIVDDANAPGRRCRPTLGAAGVVEPSVHQGELLSQSLRRHRDAHPHRIAPLGFALLML